MIFNENKLENNETMTKGLFRLSEKSFVAKLKENVIVTISVKKEGVQPQRVFELQGQDFVKITGNELVKESRKVAKIIVENYLKENNEEFKKTSNEKSKTTNKSKVSNEEIETLKITLDFLINKLNLKDELNDHIEMLKMFKEQQEENDREEEEKRKQDEEKEEEPQMSSEDQKTQECLDDWSLLKDKDNLFKGLNKSNDKRRYRELSKKFHVDKHQQSSQELQDQIEEIMKEINNQYNK